MISANEYLVWWESSLTGQHYETEHSPEAAEKLLRKREQRECFVRGFVVDMSEHTQPEDAIDQAHQQYVNRVA